MASYVERTREVVAAESDDFFQDDTILFYLNKSKEQIVSFYINLEEENNKSLRALDNLRQYKDISVNGLTFTDQGDYWSAQVPFPTGTDSINQFTFVKYANRTVMREITQHNRIKLEWGNLTPTEFESYYMITKDSGGNTVFEIFLDSDDSATSNNLRVYYILKPEEIKLSDSSLTDMPSRLENAIVYGAAKLMVSQEAINDELSQNAVQLFNQNYQEELQANSY